MILNIITQPNKILREKSIDLDSKEINSLEFTQFCKNMIETMAEKKGIGLAAPQVGKNIRIITVSTDKGPLVLINPKITKKSFSKEVDEEGCLSVPDVWGDVKRSKKITVQALNLRNEFIEFFAQGLFARVIQHEIDHLDGILFIDKAIKIKKGTVLEEK